MRPISIFLPIVTLLLLILITGCSPSPNNDRQKAETANAHTSDKPDSETTLGFTDEELRSPEFRNCLEEIVRLFQEDGHTHTYTDLSGTTNWSHTHSLGGGRSSFNISRAGPNANTRLDTTVLVVAGDEIVGDTGRPSMDSVDITGCDSVLSR